MRYSSFRALHGRHPPLVLVDIDAVLEKAWTGEQRPNHKYIKRTPKPGGGYDYEYADEHKKEHVEALPHGTTIEVDGKHYTKVGRNDWQDDKGASTASGWFSWHPHTVTLPGGSEPKAQPSLFDPKPEAPKPPPTDQQIQAVMAAEAPKVDRKQEREAKRKALIAEFERIGDSAMRGAGETPYIAKKLASLRAQVEKLGGFGSAPKAKPPSAQEAEKQPAVEKERPNNFETMPDKRDDGRIVPREGDKVFLPVRGFAGSGGSVHGVVENGRVRTTGFTGSMPNTDAPGKKMDLHAGWSVVDDPEFARREAAKGAAEKAKTDTVSTAKSHEKAAAEKAGLKPASEAKVGDGVVDVRSEARFGSGDASKVAMTDSGTVTAIDGGIITFTDDAGIERTMSTKAGYVRPKMSPMAEATKEAEKQPAVDVADAWKVDPYDAKHEAAREVEAVARDQERITTSKRHLDKTKEEVAAAKGTKKEKQAAEWLKQAQDGYTRSLEWAERGLTNRAARRAGKKADTERHAAESPARVKLAGEARERLAAEAEKAKPKKLVETPDTKKVNRQRERETGEHIPDSAKDRSDERALLTRGDLDALSFAEAHRLVNKRNAMPVYSSDQFKARGASPGAAHLGLALANLVGPSPPADSDKSRRAYLDGIRLVHGIMDHANTVDDYDAAVKELNEIAESRFGGGKPIAVIHTARKLTKEESAAQTKAGNWRSSDYEGLDRPPGNYAQEVLTPRVQKENPDLAVASRYGENGVEFYTYSTSEKSAIRASIEALGKRFNDQLMGGKGKIWSDAHRSASAAEKLGVAGWDHLEKTGEAKAEAKRSEKEEREGQESGSGKETKLRWRQSISDKPAVIKPTVDIASANVQRMNATFGFRGGQPGASIPDSELAHHHKYAEMAFHDLANVLGIEPKHVSMNGRLAMAFAARGKGKAMAHYEPEKKVINITRFAGAGTIAHEWGHFMDNTVAELHREPGVTKGRVYGSTGDHGAMPAELRDAYKAFRTALATPNPDTVRKVQADHDKRYAEAKETSVALRSHPGRLYSASPEDKADYKHKAEGHNANLDSINVRRKFLERPTSDYMMTSLAHDGGKEGKYWSSPEEMFARAFESYVQEKLEGNGRRNSYLVDGARETGDPMNDDAMPYPRKAELAKIHGAIDRVVKAMREGGHFEKALRLVLDLKKTW